MEIVVVPPADLKYPEDVNSPDDLTPEFFKSKVLESKLMEKYRLEPLTEDTFASKFMPFVEFCTGPYLVRSCDCGI